MKRPHSSTALLGCAALALASCTDSATGPDTDRTIGGPVVTAPALTNVPPIPIPAAPGGDTPAMSEIHTTIEPLDGDFEFNPVVLRAFASWTLSEKTFAGPWRSVHLGSKWSDKLTVHRTPSGLLLIPPPNPLKERILLIDGGAPVDNPRRIYEHSAGSFSYRLVMDMRTFHGNVYVKRERQWQLDPFGGAGAFHLVESNQKVTLSETRTEGSSATEITTFGTTFSAGAGLDLQVVSANLEKTLTRTFSTSVTVVTERSRQVAIDIAGEPGTLIDVRLWRLVDTYTLTDEQGNPLTHPAYVFNYSDGSMSWRTVAGTYPVQARFRR